MMKISGSDNRNEDEEAMPRGRMGDAAMTTNTSNTPDSLGAFARREAISS